MSKRIKIIRGYVLAIVFLYSYYWIETSSSVQEFVEKSKNGRIDWAFGIASVIGIAQFALLIAGISIIVILTFFLIKTRIKREN